eukprot:TRINITY_DN19656_c0_g1_i1.p1 TRINITY_DN19656_c0_g1~~TRINITY_DN19656_c0_g1_i1.p1  ORF type:complete len:266 (-),score=48.23 TRINITY_DN19656_c0_g1_i1:84-881(-)
MSSRASTSGSRNSFAPVVVVRGQSKVYINRIDAIPSVFAALGILCSGEEHVPVAASRPETYDIFTDHMSVASSSSKVDSMAMQTDTPPGVDAGVQAKLTVAPPLGDCVDAGTQTSPFSQCSPTYCDESVQTDSFANAVRDVDEVSCQTLISGDVLIFSDVVTLIDKKTLAINSDVERLSVALSSANVALSTVLAERDTLDLEVTKLSSALEELSSRVDCVDDPVLDPVKDTDRILWSDSVPADTLEDVPYKKGKKLQRSSKVRAS